jgi:hypothetical protein
MSDLEAKQTPEGKTFGGRFYYGIRLKRGNTNRLIYVDADQIRVENGTLLLCSDNNGTQVVYRAFAAGAWNEIFSADWSNGDELGEERDIDEATNKDAWRR